MAEVIILALETIRFETNNANCMKTRQFALLFFQRAKDVLEALPELNSTHPGDKRFRFEANHRITMGASFVINDDFAGITSVKNVTR